MEESTPLHPISCAIVGCGRFGQHIAELIRNKVPDLHIVAAVAHPLDNLQRVRSFLGNSIPIHHSIDELLERQANEIRAVIITSANHEHRHQAIRAANAGKHIFCEKPMALTVEDCEAMVQAATENKVKLMVGHKRRLRPTWRKLQEIAQSGELGTIVAANINGWHTHPDIPAWWLNAETGGGLLHRAGCHDIDFLHALLGPSRWVQAVASPSAHEDRANFSQTLWVTIGYDSGAIAGLQSSLWYEPTHFRDSFDVQVLGTKGSALLKRHAEQPQELFIHPEGKESQQFACVDDGTEAFVTELKSFARWIACDETPVLTWREGLACVQVMQAAYQSMQGDGARIYLQEIQLP